MCRLAIVPPAVAVLDVGEAASAAPQMKNATASIADADAYRLMNPASFILRQANARAWLRQCMTNRRRFAPRAHAHSQKGRPHSGRLPIQPDLHRFGGP